MSFPGALTFEQLNDFGEIKTKEDIARCLYRIYRYSYADILHNDTCAQAMNDLFGNPRRMQEELFCPQTKYTNRTGASKKQVRFEQICSLGSECMALCYCHHLIGNKEYTEYEMRARCCNCPHYIKSKRFDFDKPIRTPLNAEKGAEFILKKYREEIEKDKPKSFVYFISDGEFVKIGKGNNPYRRLNGIQTGNPKPCRILYLIPCKDDLAAHTVEKGLHNDFKESRCCGEWFDILPFLEINRLRMNAEFNAERWAKYFA